jgi:hypothetical protein
MRYIKDLRIVCDKPEDEMCTLPYACDGCPYRTEPKPKGFVFR